MQLLASVVMQVLHSALHGVHAFPLRLLPGRQVKQVAVFETSQLAHGFGHAMHFNDVPFKENPGSHSLHSSGFMVEHALHPESQAANSDPT